jgi:hypothetical protein
MGTEKNTRTNVAVSDDFAAVLNESLKEYITLKTVTKRGNSLYLFCPLHRKT